MATDVKGIVEFTSASIYNSATYHGHVQRGGLECLRQCYLSMIVRKRPPSEITSRCPNTDCNDILLGHALSYIEGKVQRGYANLQA